jgi:hypothetical protein
MTKQLRSFLSGRAAQSVVIAGLAALTAAEAFAQAATGPGLTGNAVTIGTIAGNVRTSLSGVSILVMALCYLGALAMGFIGALKWKAYGEQPDRTPLKVPLTLWAVAVLLAAIPEFLGTGIVTIWGATSNVAQPF